jgi:hypothetical protein
MAIPVVLSLVFYIWTTDKVTLKGERTVFTVDCRNGTWNGNQCGGDIVQGPRFRYRALKARREVVFWVLGSQEPSEKLADCAIEDGRNWTCPATASASKSLTLAMSRGKPVHNPAWSTRPFHSVSKVTWLLVKFGFKYSLVIE